MAVDEVLAQRAAAQQQCHLRIYGWLEPTVSLGYFQKLADRKAHLPSIDCPLVRRPSGGGAIVHDREITYALAVPRLSGGGDQRDLYRRVHQGVVGLLARLGVHASIFPPDPDDEAVHSPFLCFQRRVEGDVLLDGCKVVGSAQRRFRGAVLQHGSILLQTSLAAPELPGVEELSAIRLPRDEWVSLLLAALVAAFQFEPHSEPLAEEEHCAAAVLADQRFRQPQWNARR